MTNLGELRMKMTQCWKSLSLENSIIDIAWTRTSHGLERNIERLRQSWGRSDVQGHDAALTVMLNWNSFPLIKSGQIFLSCQLLEFEHDNSMIMLCTMYNQTSFTQATQYCLLLGKMETKISYEISIIEFIKSIWERFLSIPSISKSKLYFESYLWILDKMIKRTTW